MKTARFLCVALLIMTFVACQQVENTPSRVIPTIDPKQVPDVDELVFDDANLTDSLVQQATGTNLLQNGDFESLEGWTACENNPNSLTLSNDAQSGNTAALLQPAGSCFYQSVTVSPNDKISLSCYGKLLDSTGWTGIGFSFSDSNWQDLGSGTDNEVRGNTYKEYVMSSTAPANTAHASMWVYTDSMVLVDNCNMYIGDPSPPTGNLLLNPSFEQGQDNWFVCAGQNNITISTDAAAGNQAISIANNACLYQDLQVQPNLEYSLSCQAKDQNSGWSTLILSYLDENWNSLTSDSVVIGSSNYLPYKLTLTAPANTKYAAATFYSEGTTLYDDCVLKIEDDITPSQCTTNASYTVNFDATWSATTHPTGFPSNPHFSDLVGTNHKDSVNFWQVGGLASPGIEAMSEEGATAPLASEVNNAIVAGTAENVLLGNFIPSSPGSTSFQFNLSPGFSKVTLVSMIAPSPDWFVGVSGLEFCENGDWVNKSVDLFAYDAGTDSGTTYEANNANTNPQEAISRLTTGILELMG